LFQKRETRSCYNLVMNFFLGQIYKKKIISYILYFLLFSLPFTLRLPIFSFTPGWHEYETVFIGLYDVLLVLFLAIFFFNYKIVWQKYYIYLILFLGFSGLSVLFSPLPYLSIYGLIRIILFSALAIALATLIHNKKIKIDLIFLSLFFSSLFQALIGFLQFNKQEDLGLWFLGEPNLVLNGFGVSTVLIEGGKILRSYGTLPHPNILGAFLVVGFLSGLFLFIESKGVKKYLFFSGLFLIALTLWLTLSRSAIIAMLFGLFIYFILKFFRDGFYKKNIISFVSIFLLLLFSLLPVLSFVLPRINMSASEVAVTSRVSYMEMGKKIMKENLLGVGLKNQVYYTYKNNIYNEANMKNSWEWQPIHNLYLLIGSEVGVLGLLSFIIFILGAFIKKGLLFLKKDKEEYYIILAIMSSLLIIGLFDHFLYTIDSPALLFWLMIGLLL